MEVKFIELLNSYEVSAEQTTKKIADSVQVFNEMVYQYEDVKNDLEDSEDEDEREIRLEEMKELEFQIRQLDNELVKKIETWNKNKDVWAKGQKALADKRAAKKAGAPLEGSLVSSEAVYTQSPTPQPMSVGADGQISGLPSNSDFKGEGGVVKKKGSGGWWILAGIIGIVTLGAVVMKKE